MMRKCTRGDRIGECANDGRLLPQLLQSSSCFVQRFCSLAECKSDLSGAVSRIVVEARSRNGCDSNLFDQILRELDIIRKAKRADVGHHVVGSAGLEAAESRVNKCWH